MRVYLEFMGHEAVALVAYTITDYGSPPIIDYVNGGEPGWGPEWDADEIYICILRDDGYYGPAFRATGALFRALANCDAIVEAVFRDIDRINGNY